MWGGIRTFSTVALTMIVVGQWSCASGDYPASDADPNGVDASESSPDAAGVIDAAAIAGTCEECSSDANCDPGDRCVQSGLVRTCVPRCTEAQPDCPDGFECGTIEVTYCQPIGGVCCVDGDGDGFGQGVGCPGADCNDNDADVNPLMPELCNGVDDDCEADTGDGVDDPATGIPCDGADVDLCQEGATVCDAGNVVCGDLTGDTPDLCDGTDDDCNPTTADGSGDPAVGSACDGGDTDLCEEGIGSCVAGALACDDTTGDIVDLCNGVDDDCNPATADGADDPGVGVLCDGGDDDLCEEGTSFCDVAGAIGCSDFTDDTVDICDGLDNDCDLASADGSEDPLLGVACDGIDSDLCAEGNIAGCAGGVYTCDDTTDDTLEVCNGVDDDCDGDLDEGLIVDTDPLCSGGPIDLGTVRGDVGSDIVTGAGYAEGWYVVTIEEDSGSNIYLSAEIELMSPPGNDLDLFVYCNDCAGGMAGSSSNGGTTGHADTVDVRTNDDLGVGGDTFDIIIEVRHVSSTVCSDWTLTVSGNTPFGTETCN